MPFVATALTALGSAFGLSAAGAATFASVTGRLLASVALSAFSRALAPKPKAAGIRQAQTATGGTNPCGFILGTYATNGQAVCPPMSHGKAGKVPNAYLTYVIELSDVPGMTLQGMIVDGEAVTIAATAPHADYGQRITGRFDGYAWVKYYDGSQTVADAMLLAQYGSYPLRPWSADMVGRGLCYAIVTFRYDRTIFRSFPKVRFVVSGIPLYDPRKDSTVGGSGAHRWGNVATYESSSNPIVQAYNVMRGITLPGGNTWGGDASGVDLPLASWFAAMNACDVATPLLAGGTEPAYRAGYEVAVSDEPADVLDELFKGCSAQIVDMGGLWKVRVGGAGLPGYFFNDDDVIVTRPQDFDPFPGMGQTRNAVTATYPDPASQWENREAPARFNATYEAEDGGRRVVGALSLPAVPYPLQVQRLMDAYVKDERRWRRHAFALPPHAAALEPLDFVGYTSARNGYGTAKLFELAEVGGDLRAGVQQVAMREVDPADYAWAPASELPQTPAPGGFVPAPAFAVPGFTATAGIIIDNAGNPRRVSVDIYWDGAEQDAVRAVEWEINLWNGSAVGALVERASTTDVAAGLVRRTSGVMPQTSYAVRILFKGDFTPVWSGYSILTTGAVGLGNADFIGGMIATLEALGVSPPLRVAALPATGNYAGRVVMLTTDGKIYRHSGAPLDASGWTSSVDGADLLVNSITGNKMAFGTLTGDKLAARTIGGEKLLLQGANLIENPQFETGTFAGWRPFSGAGSQSVEPRSTAFIPADAPSAFVCRHLHVTTGSGVSTFNGEQAFDLPGRIAAAKPVRAGKQYRCIIDAAKNTPSEAAMAVAVYWLMADGTTGAQATSITTDVTSTWARYLGNPITAPAGAVGAWPFVFTTMTGAGAVSIYWTNLEMVEMGTAELFVDGVFAVSGMSIFGGALQSGDYEAGLAGWRITQAGAAEFNSLQVRQDMLVAGAVSRQRVFQQNLPPATSGTSSVVVLATKTWNLADFAFAPFALAAGETANPIRIDYAVKVNSVSGGVFARLRISPQYTIDGVNWIALSGFYVVKEIELRPGIGPSDHTAFDIYDVTTQNVSQWIGLRVVASAVDGSGGFPIVNISSIQCIFQQISR